MQHFKLNDSVASVCRGANTKPSDNLGSSREEDTPKKIKGILKKSVKKKDYMNIKEGSS